MESIFFVLIFSFIILNINSFCVLNRKSNRQYNNRTSIKRTNNLRNRRRMICLLNTSDKKSEMNYFRRRGGCTCALKGRANNSNNKNTELVLMPYKPRKTSSLKGKEIYILKRKKNHKPKNNFCRLHKRINRRRRKKRLFGFRF